MILRRIRERTLEQTFALSTALMVVLLIGTTLVLVHSRVAAILRATLVDRGASMARSIGAVATPSLLSYNYPALQAAAEAAAQDAGVAYVAIHDKEGNLAGQAGAAPAAALVGGTLDPAGMASDVVVAMPGEPAAEVLEVAVPVSVEGVSEAWGTVRVGLTYNRVMGKLAQVDLWLGVFGVVLALLATIAGRWVARRVTAPLRRLSEATEAVAEGRTHHRVEVGGARELAEVARAFNHMVDRVSEKARESERFRAALEALNATLEQQVQDRTRALQESEAQYKGLVQHSPDSILIVQRGRVRFMNLAFRETFGVGSGGPADEEFEVTRIFQTSSADLARVRIEAWERGETPSPVEVVGRDAGGSPRYLELRGSRIEYRGAAAAECLLIDNTETRRLRDHLVDTERLRALGELSSGVAHDFNNLLGAVLGRVQLLKRRAGNLGIDRDLAVIERAAQDGRETVRRIMEFTRTRQGQQFRAVDLAAVLRDAVEITRTRWKADAERKNIEIRLHIGLETVPAILGRESELREVFTNLILNALDAMPQGGTLRIGCAVRGSAVVAEVADTGVGMTDEIRRHLFDPFFTTKGAAGTGLGLSVVYGIVARHEGKIDLDTAVGTGTTFRIRFPIPEHPMEVAIGLGGSNESAAPVRPSRILVIDDEPDIADILREVLVAEGHTVETALCATDGLAKARQRSYDVVFTDLGMPDMSGWEVARAVRDERPGLPVVLVTGWGASLDEDELRRHQISAVVSKPFDIDDLIRATTSVLRHAAGDPV